jgi:hypothetical protein
VKKSTLILLVVLAFFVSTKGFAQTYYVKSSNGINLRKGPGTSYDVIRQVPHNAELKIIYQDADGWAEVDYRGQRGYAYTPNLSDQKTRSQNQSQAGRNNNNYNNNHNQRRQQQYQSSSRSSSSRYANYSSYTTAIGLRAGYTSGFSLKHFVNQNAAVEVVLGSRWHGFNVTAMYQLHRGNALGIPNLSWQYGLGARVGFYDAHRYYYYRGYGKCKDPYNPKCGNYYYYYRDGRPLTAWGIVGIGGLEYAFPEIPLTVSFDLIPYFYVNHPYRGFMDGSISLRYVLK